MNVVDVIGLNKSFGSRELLSGVTFAIGDDERVGLIGANGAGKSTLLTILAGVEDHDGGSIAMQRGAKVGYLSQEPVLDDDSTVAAEIEGADRAKLLDKLIEAKRKTAHLVTLQEMDARSLPARLRDGVARLLTPYL